MKDWSNKMSKKSKYTILRLNVLPLQFLGYKNFLNQSTKNGTASEKISKLGIIFTFPVGHNKLIPCLPL